MGRALYGADAAFAAAFDAALDAVGRHGGDVASLRGAVVGAATAAAATSQPALFCFEYALARCLLARLGREAPDAVVGHSLGEVAAFCVAGVLSVDGARGSSSAARHGRPGAGVGAMAAVRAGVDRVREVLGDDAPVACDNSPLGARSAARRPPSTPSRASSRRRRVARLRAWPRASTPAWARLAAVRAAAPAATPPAAVAVYSTLTGARLTDAPTADYWADQARRPLPPMAFAGQPCWFEATRAPAAPPPPAVASSDDDDEDAAGPVPASYATCGGRRAPAAAVARREGELAAAPTALRAVEATAGAPLSRVAAEVLAERRDDDVRATTAARCSRGVVRVDDGDHDEPSAVACARLVRGGAVAISGGTGAVGSRSRRISRAAARRSVVLLSRSGAVRSADEPLREALLAAAEEKRATVDVVALDVCDGGAGGAAARFGPELRGLVHGAGVVDDGALRSRTRDTLRRALDPKLGGALRLATAVDATRDAQGCPPLALEVYLSSITALLGNAGQSDYGAASAALDALAASRRRKHGPRAAALVSVQWGPWAGFGMAAKARDGGGGTPRAPFVPLESGDACALLDDALRRSASLRGARRDAAAVAFAEDHLAAARRASPLLDRLAARLRGRAGVDASLHDGAANVGDAVLRIFHAHSRAADGAITAATPLPALGLDSLEVMAIVRDVNQATGAALGVADVLGAPTLATHHAPPGPPWTAPRASRRWTSTRSRRRRRRAPDALGAELTVVDVLDGRCLADLAGACADEAPAAAAAPAPPAKEKRETPEADARWSTRLLFTLLSYALGAQLLLLGFLPCYACERYAPGRLALGPKLRLLERLVRFRAFVAVDVLLPARAAPARAWVGGDVAPGRTLAFSAEAAAAGCLYVFLWALGCHAAAVLCKWLLVGHQRPGVFPTWTSSAGYRAALLANAHAASRPDLWGAALAILPDGGVAAYLRALGADVGRDVTFSGTEPLGTFGGFDLLTIRDGAVFEVGAGCAPFSFRTPTRVALGHVHVGRHARLGCCADAKAGAHVGDGAVVCAGAGLDGPLPRGSYATSRGLRRTVPLTPSFVARHAVVDAWGRAADAAASRLVKYSGAMNAVWRALGLRVGARGAILSELLGNHALLELVDVGDFSYLAARVAVFAARVDARRGVAHLDGVAVGEGCFVGPLSVLMPGAALEDGAATGSCAVVGPGAACRRVALGDGDGAASLAWKPRPVFAFAGRERLWDCYSGALFALLNVTLLAADVVPSWWALDVLLRAVARAPWGPPAVAAAAGSRRRASPRAPPQWLARRGRGARADGVLVVLFAAVAVGRAFLFGLVHVGAKQVLLGEARDDGVAHALRGPRHVAWAATLVVGRLPGFPKPARFLFEAQRAYLRALGATVGDNVRIFPEPEVVQALPEADVVSYGAGALFSAHVYGHDFSNMHLKFRDTSVGEHCEALDAWQAQVLPGTHLPRGTRLKTLGRAIVFPGIVAEPDGDWAGNPVQRV
ncbi:polyketide synthase [Aureococcus anophagefferens]|nr:polyketide synthase [Aureococcus anophagefferens]